MASFLLRRTLTIAPSTLLLAPFALSQLRQYRYKKPLLCEGVAAPDYSFDTSSASSVPIFKRDGNLNPEAVAQLSSGSVLGLMGGLGVGFFSKTIAFFVGTAFFVLQWLASKGYHVIPTSKIQRYVKSVNVRAALEDNMAFKLSFWAAFALASFATV